MIIGITGGIGSGKSYICDIPVIDTDKIAKNDVMYVGPDSYVDGKINVKKLGDILFNDKNKLNQMNNITVPYIIKYIEKFCADKNNVLVESAALLNTDLYKHVDFVVLVFADMELRLRELKLKYNNDLDLIMSRIMAQSFDINKINYIIKEE